MQEHWRAGYHDARRTLRHREVLDRRQVLTFGLAVDARD
jgi:NTE family protein